MTKHSMRRAIANAVIAATLLASCGDTQEALLASAKDYLSKNDNNAAVIQLRNVLKESPDSAEARFLLGKVLLDTGDPLGAEKELRRALELQYSAEQAVPPLARSLVLLGRYKEVTSELAGVPVVAAEAKAELLTAVGQAHLAQGNSGAARNAFAMALAAQPKHIAAHLGQAQILATSGNLASAAAAVDGALAISPTDADALQLKGDILAEQRQLEPALLAYRKAVEAKPDYLPAHAAIILSLIQENRLEDAAKQVQAMKQVAPTHSQTFYLQALLTHRQKDFTSARHAIQQHLRATPDNLRGLLLAGAIELELKNYGQAEGHLLKVLERVPQQQLARRMLIAAYMRSGQGSKALDTLKPILDTIEKDANLLALAGEVFIVNGQLSRAADYFAKATVLDPGDARKRTAVALTHMATGESDKAFQELERAAASDSGVRADLALIAGHMQRRDYDKALTRIAVLEKKQPGTALPHNLRGSALIAKRDLAGARRAFEKALEIDPTYFLAAASLAELDLADNKEDAARRRFEAVLAKDNKHMQALVALAALHARFARNADKQLAAGSKQFEPDEAVALLNKAISEHPTEAVPRLALIGYYLSVNDAKKAVIAAQKAVVAFPNREDVLDAAGRAYQAAGDSLQALMMYRKLASLQRGSPQPHLRMAEIHMAAKNKDEAMNSLRKALDIKSDLVDAQRGIIALELDAGRMREAMAIARQVQKQRPRDSAGYMFEGDIHARHRNWAEAATAYRAGLGHVKSTDLAARLYVALAASSGEDAERFATSWLADHPTDAEFRVNAAQSAAARNDHARAAQHYRKLLESRPNNPLLLNNLAFSEAQLKMPSALQHAERANELAPEQPAIMDTLGVLLVEKGDIARGLELLKKASSAAPHVPGIRLNLAKALIKAGQKDAARKELDELAKLGDKFPGQAEAAQLRLAL